MRFHRQENVLQKRLSRTTKFPVLRYQLYELRILTQDKLRPASLP